MSNEESLGPWQKEAKEQFEKVAKNWPEGDLMQSAYNSATEIPCKTYIQYTFQPTQQEEPAPGPESGFQLPFFLEINLYIGVEPDAVFQSIKEYFLSKGEDNFIEWPSSFPDSGNDYQFVSHCAATKNRSEVAFTQGKSDWTLVMLSGTKGGNKLVEYADGAWQVVYGMGLCN